MSPPTRILRCLILLLAATLAGCGGPQSDATVSEPAAETVDAQTDMDGQAPAASVTKTMGNMSNMGGMAKPDPASIVFKDEIESNAEVPEGLDGLVFTDTQGQRVRLEDYVGKQHVVLVFTEGFDGMLCPFCTTQTSRLVANYDQLKDLGAEVLVVYPGARDHVEEFIEAARSTGRTQVERVPFPIVLDEEFQAVNYFGIRAQHAHPSTFVIDRSGNVRLAYVGAGMTADRPSVKALLEKLNEANQDS